MKKLLLLAGTALLLASCGSETYYPWADPQSTEAEAAKSVTFTATANPTKIAFEEVTTDSVMLFTPVVTSTDEVASQNMTVTLYNVTGSAEYVLVADSKGRVSAEDLKRAVETLYGKSGEPRTIDGIVKNVVKLSRGEGFTLTAPLRIVVQLVAPRFAEFIYEIGNDSQWQTVQPLRSPDVNGKYEGYGYLDGEFKFRSHPTEWKGPDWEYGGAEGLLSENGTGNIPAVAAGFYRMIANIANGTYELTKLDLGIIGSATGTWDYDQDMVYDRTERAWVWTGNLVDGEIKFRANDAWTDNWGGDVNNLSHGGGNIAVTAGNYTIKLYLTYVGNHKVVLTKN